MPFTGAHGKVPCVTISGILTAMVTPFGADGALAEEPTAALVRHLLASGSDGVVLTGTTGEASTLSDDEKARVWDIGVEVSRAERPGAPVIAGTGSNDTRHSVELTGARRCRGCRRGAGRHSVLQPSQPAGDRGPLSRRSRTSTDLPIVALQHPRAHGRRHAERPARGARPDRERRRRQAGALRGRGADRRSRPARGQRRPARDGAGHGRNRRDPRRRRTSSAARCGG